MPFLVHFAFSTGFTVVYRVLAERFPQVKLWQGAAFGVLVPSGLTSCSCPPRASSLPPWNQLHHRKGRRTHFRIVPAPLEPALRRALLGVLRPHHLDAGDRGLPPRPARPKPATGEEANRANAPAGNPSGGALTCTAPAAPNPTGRAGAAIRRRG